MAAYNFTRTCRGHDMFDHLVTSLGAHFTSVEGFNTEPDGTLTTGRVIHDGTLTDPQIQGAIDSYALDLRVVESSRTKTGSTSGTTPQTVAPLQLPENCVAEVFAYVVASSGNNVARWKIEATAKRAAGNAIMVDTPIPTKWDDTALASAAANIVVTGQSVAVQVTGIAATNITWTGRISYRAVVS